MFIYQIRNVLTDRVYVGLTINLNTRWAYHKRMLNKKSHDNKYLENAWHKYGQDHFVFEVLEEVDTIEELEDRELYYITSLPKVYNLLKEKHTQRSPSCPLNRSRGENHYRYGQAVSEEVKEKISKTKKKQYKQGLEHGMKGKTHTKQSRNKMSRKVREAFANYKDHPSYDNSIFVFYNEKTKEEFVGSKKDFISKLNLKQGARVYDVCNGNRRTVYKWRASCLR